MGQEVKVIYTDDLKKSQGERLELEPGEVREEDLAWSGKAARLILSEATWKEIDDFLAPLIEAGSPVAATPGMRRPGRKTARRSDARSQALGRLRDWADQEGRTDEYTTPGGGFWPKTKLLKDFAEATGEVISSKPR
jgi:hypothetical protein